MMDRSLPPLIPSMDRFAHERSFGQHPPPIQPIQSHSQSQSSLERHNQAPPSSPNNSNQSLSPASSPTNSLQQQSKRRRVPAEERKRTAMSCDRCKSRKIKVPPSGRLVLMW